MPRPDKGKTMTELLRQALSEAESLRAVERETGVKRQSVMKFIRGEQSLRLDLADKLAAHFGIESHRKGR
jgi:plasmid maintenance system antidote protein VapI